MKTGKPECVTSAASCAPSTTPPETSARTGSSRCSSVWGQGMSTDSYLDQVDFFIVKGSLVFRIDVLKPAY